MSMPIMVGKGLVKSFGHKRWFSRSMEDRRAVDTVDVTVNEGETLAIVGESGSGKSTLARMLLSLSRPTSGQIYYHGRDIASFGTNDWVEFRRRVQPIFQDPASSLNPRMRVETTLSNVLRRHGYGNDRRLREKVDTLLQSVGLAPDVFRNRYPHQLSGGQQQRIAIARAMSIEPKLIIADEPLSSLDMSVQAQVLALLLELKKKNQLSLVMISHDLNVVQAVSDRVMVMFQGKVVEEGPTREVLTNPKSDYTQTLLAAKLVADPRAARARQAKINSDLANDS